MKQILSELDNHRETYMYDVM